MGLRGPREPITGAGRRYRAAQQDLGERYARQVLELTNRLAEVMLSSGSGAADVVSTAQDVAHAYRLIDCVVEITFTTIIVSALPAPDTPQVTLVRSVRSRSTDYTRLSELDNLVRRITAGGVTVDEAHQEMDAITERPHPYPRWLSTAAWAGFALGIALLLGGRWETAAVATVTTAAIDRVGRMLNHARTPFFFQQATGAAIATAVAVVAWRFLDLSPSVLVGTGIVVLLSGLALVGSVQDALTGYMVTASARLGDVIFLTAGIVVGILGVLQLARAINVYIRIDVSQTVVYAPSDPASITAAVFGGAIAGAFFAVACYAPLRGIAVAGAAAGLAEGLVIALNHAGFGQVVSTGLAAVAVGVAATLGELRRRSPALVIATAGITPMLPGLAVFRAVFQFAGNGELNEGIRLMLAAVATAVALGAGVVLGEFLGSPLRASAGRLGRWLRIEGASELPGVRRSVGRDVDLQAAAPTGAAPPSPGQSTSSVALAPATDEEPATDHPADAATASAAREPADTGNEQTAADTTRSSAEARFSAEERDAPDDEGEADNTGGSGTGSGEIR
jgi:uncharacterized membrane protein YjjP (DUF1212 family)